MLKQQPVTLDLMPAEQAMLAAVDGWYETYVSPTVADFPLLMNIEAEVAIAEAEMDAAGFAWDEVAQTWTPKAKRPSARARRAQNRAHRRMLKMELAMYRGDAYAADYDEYLDSLPA